MNDVVTSEDSLADWQQAARAEASARRHAYSEIGDLKAAITRALMGLDALLEDQDGIDPWAVRHINDARDALLGVME
jgi:hypothetical protein